MAPHRSRRFTKRVEHLTVLWLCVGVVVPAFGGCTCSSKATTLGECGPPLSARLERLDEKDVTVAAGGGHGVIVVPSGIQKSTTFFLDIETRPNTRFRYDFPGSCDSRYELVPDADAKRLAVRCPSSKTTVRGWDIFYVQGPGRVFQGDTWDGPLAWDKVPDFHHQAAVILTKHPQRVAVTMTNRGWQQDDNKRDYQADLPRRLRMHPRAGRGGRRRRLRAAVLRLSGASRRPAARSLTFASVFLGTTSPGS